MPILLLVSGLPQSGKSTWTEQLGPVQIKYAWEYLGGPGAPELLNQLNSILHKNTKGRIPHVVPMTLSCVDYDAALHTLGKKGSDFRLFEHIKLIPFEQWPYRYRQEIPKLFLDDTADVTGRLKGTLQQLYERYPMSPLTVFDSVVDTFPGPPELLICDDFRPEYLDQITTKLKSKDWNYDIYHVYVTYSGVVEPPAAPTTPVPDLIVTTAGLGTLVLSQLADQVIPSDSPWFRLKEYTVV